MADDFATAIPAGFVHEFSYEGACPLVLHARFDEVDGVDGGGADGCWKDSLVWLRLGENGIWGY